MQERVYRFADFSLDPEGRKLSQGARAVTLAPKCFDALCLLVRSHGDLVSKEQFLKALWPNVHVSEANLTNIIVELRRLFGRDAVQTVSKFGYRFNLQVEEQHAADASYLAHFARGRELMAERSLPSIEQARDLFLVCVARDPEFAMGWAWLGRVARVLEKFRSGAVQASGLAEAAFARAFALDPDLACAHQFYTQLQVDTGRSLQALQRLTGRLAVHGQDAQTLAGMVHVLRCCGLLEESVAVNDHAKALDPTVGTSVAHTYFLQGDYPSVFGTYVGEGYYLDAAAWAAMGQTDRALALLHKRLKQPELSPLMLTMMQSLAHVLQGNGAAAVALATGAEITDEPEAMFYFARHCGMAQDAAATVDMVRRARLAGFWSSTALERDASFNGLRHLPEFACEAAAAKELEANAMQQLRTALEPRLMRLVASP